MVVIAITGGEQKRYALYQYGRSIAVLSFTRERDETVLEIHEQGQLVRREDRRLADFHAAIDHVIEYAEARAFIATETDIERVAFLVAVPGAAFQSHQIITDAWRSQLADQQEVAPAAVSPLLAELDYVRSRLAVPMVAVSDTAFLSTIANRSFVGGGELATRFGIERYGYGGVTVEAALHGLAVLAHDLPNRTVVCSIDERAVVTAVRDGQALTSSGGFLPDVGQLAGYRGTDLDGGALAEIVRQKQWTGKAVHAYLSEPHVPLRNLALLHKWYAAHDAEAAALWPRLVLDLQMAIGAAIAALGGVDALVITGSQLESSPVLRERILAALAGFGVRIDEQKNELLIGRNGYIHERASAAGVVVLRTSVADQVYRIAERVIGKNQSAS